MDLNFLQKLIMDLCKDKHCIMNNRFFNFIFVMDDTEQTLHHNNLQFK